MRAFEALLLLALAASGGCAPPMNESEQQVARKRQGLEIDQGFTIDRVIPFGWSSLPIQVQRMTPSRSRSLRLESRK